MLTELKKVDNHGGARPGSGPKPRTLSARQVRLMLDRAKEHAEIHGKTVDEVLLEFIYSNEEKTADVLAAIKIFKTYTMAKLNEVGETDQQFGPGIFLPEQRPDLALSLDSGLGKSNYLPDYPGGVLQHSAD